MERLEMSQKERRRLEVLNRVKRGELSLLKAAELLHLSYRQAKRVYRTGRGHFYSGRTGDISIWS